MTLGKSYMIVMYLYYRPQVYTMKSMTHRHLSNIDCLSFVLCLLLGPVLIGFFSSLFAAAVNSTNEANKADSMRC